MDTNQKDSILKAVNEQYNVIAELESEISNLGTEITELKVSLKYCKETVRMFQVVTNKLIQYKGHVNDHYWEDQNLAYDKQQELSTSIALKNKELKRLKITLDVLKGM